MEGKKKSKAGRKKGAVSFCMVPLSELNSKLNANAIVILSRKFAAAMGIEGQPIVAAPNMIVPFAQAQVAQSIVQVTTFDEDYPDGPITEGDKKLKKMIKESKEEEELTPQVTTDSW